MTKDIRPIVSYHKNPNAKGKHGPWTAVDSEHMARRAGARRKWNAERRRLANLRRVKVLALLQSGMRLDDIALALKVFRTTVYRDRRIIEAQIRERNMSTEDLFKALSALRFRTCRT